MQRHFNWQGQQRVDVPHLRLVESAVTQDFQLLAGQVMAGATPLVIRGFTIPVTGAIGNPAENLTLLTAAGVLLHATAAESGTVFAVPNSQAPEALNGTNPKVVGSFVAGTNYVGIDLVRIKDESTQDSVAFLSDATGREFTQPIPLGRSLQYRIYIQTSDFDHTPSVLPVAKVVVASDGTVVSITDARNMAFRLGRGGTQANAAVPYISIPTRTENPITAQSGSTADPFVGCDKSFVSVRDWMGFVMSRLWEVGGGEYWYSPTADREVKLSRSVDANSLFASTGENFEWDIETRALRWKGLRFVFGHSTGWYNTIQDETTGVPLSVGECLYVDLNRKTNTTVVAAKGTLTDLGQPDVPGTRFIFAWRSPDGPDGQIVVQTRDGMYPVGYSLSRATTSSFGIVRLYAVAQDQADAIVPIVDSTGRVVATGLTNPPFVPSVLNIGTGIYDSGVNIGKTTTTAAFLGAVTVAQGFTATGVATLNGGLIVPGGGGQSYFHTDGTVDISTAGQLTTIYGTLQVDQAATFIAGAAFNGQRLQNVASPASASDGVNRSYVDGFSIPKNKLIWADVAADGTVIRNFGTFSFVASNPSPGVYQFTGTNCHNAAVVASVVRASLADFGHHIYPLFDGTTGNFKVYITGADTHVSSQPFTVIAVLP